MKNKKSFAICLFVVVVSVVTMGCAKEKDVSLSSLRQEEGSPEEMAADSEGKIMTFSLSGFTEGGKKKWKIEGKSADIMSDKLKLEDVKIRAYSQEGLLTITARRGYFDRLTNNVRLEEDVVAVTDEGARLTTDYLDWQAEDEIVSTEASVFVERENLTASGIGAYAVPSLRQVRLNKNVTVTVTSLRSVVSGEATRVTTITSTGSLDIDSEKQIAVFNDHVEVNDERGKIFGDRIDLYLNPKEKKITKAIALGNVRILRDGNTTYSQKAVYEAEEGKLTLTGRPRLVMYE